MISIEALASIPGLRHGYFTRNGPGETLGQRNCAYRTGDDTAQIDRNREACAVAVGTSLQHLVTVKQRHTPDVLVVDAPITWADAPIADAMVTRTPGLSLGILTADCVPVLFADSTGAVVAAAHAGWRGAFEGVLENTVQQMALLGAARGQIIAAVGPCIGKDSYEVGPEFWARFVARDADYERYFSTQKSNGHSHFDLATFAADRLKAAGVGQVVVSGHDTCTE
jgi:YfiH family protein